VSADALLEIAHADTVGWFHDASGRLSNWPAELAAAHPEPDPRAIFSALQFGTIVPPLSAYQGVSRLVPGYRYEGTTPTERVSAGAGRNIAVVSADEQCRVIERIIDAAIDDAVGDGPDPVLLFSGGVDSGLFAARLAARGRSDAILANYAFSDDDPESELAEAMAAHLGLRFVRLRRTRPLADCLVRPGRTHAQPLGDMSTGHALDLAYQVIERFSHEGRIVLDGTGADSAMGLRKRLRSWSKLRMVPRPVRSVMGSAYPLALWDHPRAARLLGAARRSASIPLAPAILAQNPLAGILYDDRLSHEVYRTLDNWVRDAVGGSYRARAIATDLMLIGPGMFAQKALRVFEGAGMRVCFPFLSTEILATAFASVDSWPTQEPKAALKQCLARHVPHEWVYRPKSPFLDPAQSLFRDPDFIGHLRGTVDADGPIAHMLDRGVVLKACDLLGRGEVPPVQTLNGLWAATFTDRWYRTAQ